ncbi:MAG: response regulator [Bdellovibrionaceae bacterium]|nr:response regulator [Pseudobdellovibrionaceae bacterium]
MAQRVKVLIIDSETQLSRRLGEHIRKFGFDPQYVNTIKDARAKILVWHPKVVICNLVLSDGSGYEVFNFIQKEESLEHDFTIFMLTSAHNQQSNVREALSMGIKDYIVKPFKMDEVLNRIIFQCRSLRMTPKAPPARLDAEGTSLLHLTSLTLKQALNSHSFEDTLFNLTKMLSMKANGVRCNIVHCISEKEGIIVTSNDDKGASGININLNVYPEILHVRNTGRLIAIENLNEDENLRFIKSHVKNINFNSLVVCPIEQKGEFFGVLSLKLAPDKKQFTDNEIRFAEIVSNVISLTLNSYNQNDENSFWLKKSQAKAA